MEKSIIQICIKMSRLPLVSRHDIGLRLFSHPHRNSNLKHRMAKSVNFFCLCGYNILKPFVYLQHETADYNIWQIFWRIYGGTDRQGKGESGLWLVLLKTQDRLPTKFVKHIRDGLYELRTEFNGNIYRVFFIFDEGKIVVLFNGFQKKTQKTPASEITKALKIKEEYYEYKRNNGSGL